MRCHVECAAWALALLSALPAVRADEREGLDSLQVRTGALYDSYLGRGRPLGQARLLFEVGIEGSDIASLRERLLRNFLEIGA